MGLKNKRTRQAIIAHYLPIQRHRCVYCRCKLRKADEDGPQQPTDCTIDHRTPVGRGGTDDWGNLCLACRACNDLKGESTDAEFLEWLADEDQRAAG